ncbi:MAG: EAL domain-containing response regulator [Rhizobiaceae bacterium]
MNKQVLIIEDDEMINDLVSRTVERCSGCSSICVFNGNDGLAAIAASEQPIDIIVLDLSLPDVDGLEFIRSLAKTSFAGGLIIASGHSMAILNASKLLAGYHNITVLDVLQKPFSPKQLREVISNASAPASASKLTPGNRGKDIAGSHLVPYYQPQIDINSGAVVGFEALIRLQLAAGPIVGPDILFSRIRNAEERISTSLVISRLVLRDLGRALAETTDFPGVSINFDARILEDDKTMAAFTNMVQEMGIPPSCITVEVIEKSLPNSDAQLLEALTRLSMAGFKLSLDDYGAGGSNQDLLRRSPFDELKLDHSLIQSGLDDPISRKFVSAAVETARGLKLDLVGEGVETPEHLTFVVDQGIEIVQGFLFERPMPIEQAIQFTQSKQALPKIA